jgi:hypothetical protein
MCFLEILPVQFKLITSSSILISVSARESSLLGVLLNEKISTLKIIPDDISRARTYGDHAHGYFASISSLGLFYETHERRRGITFEIVDRI